MASFFAQLFACCLRNRLHSSGRPDEHTHLIPPTHEVPPNRTYVVDQQKMNERLGTIVRAKEGKMAKLSHDLPLNLQNREFAVDPSLTRSHSTTAYAPHLPPQVNASTSQHRIPSYSPVRPDSIQTSRSTSSLRPGDASYLPPEEDPEHGVRKPVFNARLVRVAGPGTWKRRGRSSTKGWYTRSEEREGAEQDGRGDGNGLNDGNGVDRGLDKLENEQGESESDSFSDTPSASPNGHAQLAHEPPSDGKVATARSESGDPGHEANSEDALKEAGYPSSFHIHDVGKIAQSWGD